MSTRWLGILSLCMLLLAPLQHASAQSDRDLIEVARSVHPRRVEYMRAREKQILITFSKETHTDAAGPWSKLLGKEITYAGHGDFDAFEAQLRKTGRPSWLA